MFIKLLTMRQTMAECLVVSSSSVTIRFISCWKTNSIAFGGFFCLRFNGKESEHSSIAFVEYCSFMLRNWVVDTWIVG